MITREELIRLREQALSMSGMGFTTQTLTDALDNMSARSPQSVVNVAAQAAATIAEHNALRTVAIMPT